MKQLFCLLLLAPAVLTAQSSYFSKPSELKGFADYLFCTRDYLRAADEYKKYLLSEHSDTAEFKSALAFYYMEQFEESSRLSSSNYKGGLSDDMKLLSVVSLFRGGQFENLDTGAISFSSENYRLKSEKLVSFSLMLRGNISEKERILQPFLREESTIAESFYERAYSPAYRSPVTAGVLSALVPGLGKVYSGKLTDGLISFLLNGTLAFLSYDNFRAGHKVRGIIFTALAGIFYAGNIYGSAAAANIYNAGVSFNFQNDIQLYLNNQNYYLPKYEFCN